MLKKLLKYDLKYMIKNMSPFYILSIIFSITTRILFSIKQTVIVNVMGQISVGCLFAMLINIIINSVMRSWIRFRDSLYKDESYLTHTLPVTKNQLYQSKFIQTIIFVLVGFSVIVLSLFIAYYSEEKMLMLKELINNISKGINIKTIPFVISLLVVIFVEIINAIQSGYLGIILGYKKNNYKTGFSIFFGFIAYSMSQVLVVLFLFLIGLFNSNILNLFKSSIILNNETIKLILALSITIYTIIIIIMNIVGSKILNKGVNIE